MTAYTRHPLYVQRATKSTSTYWLGSRTSSAGANVILTETSIAITTEDGVSLVTEN